MLKAEEALSVSKLHELFTLNAETGQLFWRERPAHHFLKLKECMRWNTRYAGKEAFHENTGAHQAYRHGKIDYRKHWAHRVIWAMTHGEWPKGSIDHIDGNSLNNRPANLRDVPQLENIKNQKLRSTNKSGVMGVRWRVNRSRWEARINDGPKRVIIGLYREFDDAVAARRAAERDLGYHPNHGTR